MPVFPWFAFVVVSSRSSSSLVPLSRLRRCRYPFSLYTSTQCRSPIRISFLLLFLAVSSTSVLIEGGTRQSWEAVLRGGLPRGLACLLGPVCFAQDWSPWPATLGISFCFCFTSASGTGHGLPLSSEPAHDILTAMSNNVPRTVFPMPLSRHKLHFLLLKSSPFILHITSRARFYQAHCWTHASM